MAYSDAGKVISMIAGDTMGAHIVVYCSASGTVSPMITNSTFPIGVTVDSADSGGSIGVQVSGVAKVYALTSIGAGNLVVMSTDGAGYCKHGNTANNTATTTNIPVIGIALENGSNSSIIPVLLQLGTPLKRGA